MRVRLARGVAAFTISALLLGAALEGLLRLALNADDGPLATLAAPWRYGQYNSDDAHWEIGVLGGPPAARVDSPEYHPRYGWRCWMADPDTLAHRDEALLDGRRPLLLFGDSYAAGVIPDTWHDFRRYTERSDLSDEFALLNYGLGGAGFDQIWLLLRDVVVRHAPARPVVIVSLLVDDDLDRCVLAFRGWPKPRLRVVDGRLVEDPRGVPRMEEYFESHASVAPLLSVPFLAHHLDRVTGVHARAIDAEKQALARALVEAVVDELRGHDLPFLFVIFHHSWSLEQPTATGWRVPLLTSTLDGLGAPWVTVRPALRDHAARTGRSIADYFLRPEHPHSGHYNALGDAVSFEVVREGLKQHLGIGGGGNLVLAQDVQPAAGAARVEWREHDDELAALGLAPPYLWAVFDESGAAQFCWTPDGGARALRGRATLARGELTRWECERDGVRAPLGERFEIELDGVTRLTLSAAGPPGGRLILSEVTLEPARRVPPPLGPDPR